MFIVEKKSNKSVARRLEDYDAKMKTDFKIIDKQGKVLCKKMDKDTFLQKFG